MANFRGINLQTNFIGGTPTASDKLQAFASFLGVAEAYGLKLTAEEEAAISRVLSRPFMAATAERDWKEIKRILPDYPVS